MQIAALHASDASQYRELMLHAYAAAADAFTSTPEERAAEPESWWVRRVADPASLSLTFGAFDAGRLVGAATIEFSAKPKTQHKAHLIGMFVRASCRGRGAGAALVQAALAAAAARAGVKLVTLTVTEGNAAAIALYRRCGFRWFGTEPAAIATPNGYKAKVHMWAPLAAYGGSESPAPPATVVAVDAATADDLQRIEALMQFYNYDMSQWVPVHFGSAGLYDIGSKAAYWRNPAVRPYVVRVDHKLAGFAVVDDEFAQPGAQFNMGYFFVARRFRQRGVGRQLLADVVRRHPGRWQIYHYACNEAASGFWSAAIPGLAGGATVTRQIVVDDLPTALYEFSVGALPG